MALSSMTGFARGHGVNGAYAWSWEVRSVNAKGLDVRLRLPPGWDAIEVPARARAAALLSRGNVNATLSVEREGVAPVVRINESVLAALMETMRSMAGKIEAAPPRLDGILALKGVVDVISAEDGDAEKLAAEQAIIAGFDAVMNDLVTMRKHEGAALGRVLSMRLSEIAALAARAEANPGRRAEAVKARISEQVAALLDASDRFDADRLHQEAVLIAVKADIREELDRLTAHVAQTESLIAQGGAIGRRLDFLAQEFNRETNTLCAKSNDVELTNIGLELKSVVEQFREQVQNLE